MAIDDNTSYELYGSQIKDLASRIKGNTALAKNLAGGSDKTSKLIYMTAINGTDAMRIAEEIDPQQASAAMVTSLMKYRFYNAETGEEYSDLNDIMDVLDTELGLIEYVQTPSDNSNYPIVKMVESAVVRADGNDYYIDIVLKTFDKTSLAIKTENITFGPDTQYNLYWYKAVSDETLIGQARGYVQQINSYQSKIADEINASLPSDTPAGEYISASQVGSFMKYAFFSSAGNLLKTPSDIRIMLTRSSLKGPLVFVPSQNAKDTGWSLTTYSWTGTASTGFGYFMFFDPHNRQEKNYFIKAVNASQYTDGRKHAWYEVSYDDTYEFQYSGGYANSGYPVDPSTETPEFTYQLAYDQSDNLYMAVNSSSAADWKQINNTLYADTITSATAVESVTTNMIANEAVTAAKLAQSVFDAIYPVGSIYMSATMSTVAAVEAAFGGTWVAWGAGRVPVGVDTSQTEFDTVEETGGEKTHTLITSEMPSHDHNALNWASGYSGGSQSGFKTILEGNPTTANVKACNTTGGDQAHNNLQPYITCYMYKRTA